MGGIALLVYALIVSSLMGLIQEKTYKTYGKHPNEALFIDHVLGLPMFYFFSTSIKDSFTNLLNTEKLADANLTLLPSNIIPESSSNIPVGVVFRVINILT